MPSKFNSTNFIIIKIIRLMIASVAVYFATNYMSQIYTEAVLVNDEDPPKLFNFVIVFLIIDTILNVLALLIVFLALDLQSQEFIIIVFDYIVTIIIFGVLLSIIAGTMYDKKFFLYKDDGLRAIRALSSIMYKFIFIICLMPYGLLIKDNAIITTIFDQPTSSVTPAPLRPVASSISSLLPK